MKEELLLILTRTHKKDDYTIGILSFKGFDEHGNFIEKNEKLCNTLEDKVRVLKSKQDKVDGETAIPEGKYKVKITTSTKFKRELPELLNVPYFEGVRIHRGNKATHTEGCILPGINNIVGWVSDSETYEKRIIDLIRQYKESWIQIK